MKINISYFSAYMWQSRCLYTTDSSRNSQTVKGSSAANPDEDFVTYSTSFAVSVDTYGKYSFALLVGLLVSLQDNQKILTSPTSAPSASSGSERWEVTVTQPADDPSLIQ